MAKLDKNDPEMMAEVNALIKEAVDVEAAGLKAKNTELLGKLKDANIKITSFETEAEARERADLEAKGDHEKLRKKIEEDAQKAAKALQDQLEAERAATRKLLVSDGLNAAIAAAGIAPHFTEAVRKLLIDQVEVVDQENGRVAVAKTATGNVGLADFVKQFAASDAGKHFAAAPINGGSGAANKGNTSGVMSNPWKKETRNLTLASKLKQDNPELAARLMAEAGVSRR